MVRVRVIPKAEAQQVRRSKEPGPHRLRMDQFSEYARLVRESPDEAVVFEELDEEPQRFVLSLRGALRRAGVQAVVRKLRGRDEVRVWLADALTPRVEEPVQKARSGRTKKK